MLECVCQELSVWGIHPVYQDVPEDRELSNPQRSGTRCQPMKAVMEIKSETFWYFVYIIIFDLFSFIIFTFSVNVLYFVRFSYPSPYCFLFVRFLFGRLRGCCVYTFVYNTALTLSPTKKPLPLLFLHRTFSKYPRNFGTVTLK